MRYQAPRGTRDVLPDEVWKWQHVEAAFRETAARFGHREIRTPVFEETELFARGIGDSTDIVRKEMYTFADRKGRSLTLRPEGTAGAVRAYVEHAMGRGGRVTKLFYFCPMFRYERPQAGRYRQFWQWGLESLGSLSPAVDAEIIHFSVSLFARLGIRGTEARVSSAGCPNCTPAYNELIRTTLAGRLDAFCDDCRVRFERNPRRMFDCKNSACLEALRSVPGILGSLCGECREHFERVQAYLGSMGVPHRVDESLARGLDYYTKTVFEVHHAGLGAQSALCGGGRYDHLVEEVGGDPTPACGVSGGVERLLATVESEGALPASQPGTAVAVVWMGGPAALVGASIAAALRERAAVEMDCQERSLKAQLRDAARLGARFAVIVGEDEVGRGVAVVKDMATGEQQEFPVGAVAGEVGRRLETA
jgi:histidyl-tRNA synthetase